MELKKGWAEWLEFEKARANWLKELNSRTLSQYADDTKKEQNERVAKNTTL